MMRNEVLFVLGLFVFAAFADQISDQTDAELERFKRAERQKRSVTDSKTLVKCVLPIMKEEESGKSDMTDDDEANQLAGCIVRSAWKKQQEGSDNAGNMVRRIAELVKSDKISVSRRGWWRKTVKKVSGWFKKHGPTIIKGLKIAGDIIKKIWGK